MTKTDFAAAVMNRRPSGTPSRALGRERWPRFLTAFLVIHGMCLVLYAVLGKGFAYAGSPPIFVGELLLLFAGIALIATRRAHYLVATTIGILLVLFVFWQIVCMLPHVEYYGLDALRDSVVWAYALFAWTGAALCLRLRGLLPSIVTRFQQFGKVYAIAGPISFLASLYLRDILPQWPGTSVTVPMLKGADYCVHLAGILAFVSVGLGKMSGWWLAFVSVEALLGMSTRGGLLSFMTAAALVLFLRPKVERVAIVFGSALLLIVAMAAFDLEIATPKASRSFSLTHLSDSVASMFSSSQQSTLEGTKNWRLAWWGKIWGYTVEGPYFWMGKGYGVNLANDDGFQVGTREEPLRSPHSSHLTFLARSGVPGILLWVALQLAWAGSMLTAHLRARRRGMKMWSSLFAWVLSYWAAFMVSAAVDVFFEGPMAGIPFWTLFGVGWGAEVLFRSALRQQRLNPIAIVAR